MPETPETTPVERSPDDTTEGPRDLLFNEICELFRNPKREWTLADELIALLARLGLLNSQPVRDAELERLRSAEGLRSALDGAKNHIGDVLRRLEQAEAERDALKAAIERVRAVCAGGSAGYTQRTVRVVDVHRALDTPTPTEEGSDV